MHVVCCRTDERGEGGLCARVRGACWEAAGKSTCGGTACLAAIQIDTQRGRAAVDKKRAGAKLWQRGGKPGPGGLRGAGATGRGALAACPGRHLCTGGTKAERRLSGASINP
jgi:hypothetical protein